MIKPMLSLSLKHLRSQLCSPSKVFCWSILTPLSLGFEWNVKSSNFKLILVIACWGTQHWFRQIRLGATRHQAVTWGNVDPVVCHHMVSLGQKEWKLTPFWQVTNCIMTCSSGWDHIIGAHWNLVMPSIYWEPWAIIGNGLLPIIWHKTTIWTHTDFWQDTCTSAEFDSNSQSRKYFENIFQQNVSLIV